jgi:hypothetical protein
MIPTHPPAGHGAVARFAWLGGAAHRVETTRRSAIAAFVSPFGQQPEHLELPAALRSPFYGMSMVSPRL